jgi:hypothetical protein
MWIEVLYFIAPALIGIFIMAPLSEWLKEVFEIREIKEYHSNGRVKLIGQERFNKRIGLFVLFDEKGKLSSTITYRKGKIYYEYFYNPTNGKIWKSDKYYPISETYYNLRHSPCKIQGNREIVLEVVKKEGLQLEYASDELKNDRELVLAAVKANGSALEYASDELKNDREVVVEAVKCNAYALDYTSDYLKNDKEIILEAINRSSVAFQFVSDKMKLDEDILNLYLDQKNKKR